MKFNVHIWKMWIDFNKKLFSLTRKEIASFSWHCIGKLRKLHKSELRGSLFHRITKKLIQAQLAREFPDFLRWLRGFKDSLWKPTEIISNLSGMIYHYNCFICLLIAKLKSVCDQSSEYDFSVRSVYYHFLVIHTKSS